MAQTKPTGLSIEDLKKSLKTLTSEMNPEQLKRANETLEKLESVTAKSNEDNIEIQKTNVKIEKHLSKNGDLNKTLLGLQKLYKDTQKEDLKYKKQSLAKLDRIGGGTGINKVGPIREDRALTLREQLKETVAGGKGAVSSIGRGIGAIGSGIRDVFTKPGEVFNKVKGKVTSTYQSSKESIKDIASTKEDYDPRSERFEDRFVASKADQRKEQGSLLDPKLAARLDKNVAKVSYKKMLGDETDLIELNKNISEFERSGLPVPKVLTKQKETLEKTHKEADVRSTFAGAAEKANEAAEKSSLEATKKARDENPEGDNIVSANEKMADSLKELTLTSNELLSTTKESVDILKGIRQDLARDDIQPLESKGGSGTSGAASAEAAVAGSSGPGIGDALDLFNKRNSPGGAPKGGTPKPSTLPSTGGGKPSLGGRIMGGLKKAGPGLLKGGIGAIGGMALGYGAEKLIESGHEKVGGALDVGAEALSGAGMGAMIGSVVPGVGTAIGGAIGGIAGGAYGLYKNRNNLFGGGEDVKTGTGASGFPLADAKSTETVTSESYMKIGGERYNPDADLSPTQMAAITMGTMSGNSYPPDVMKKFNEQKKKEPKPTGNLMDSRGDGSNVQEFAKGGPVKGGGAENGADYLVGEEGPELFVPFKDGVVIPNDVSKKLAPAKIKGLANGGIALNDDGSYNKGNRTYSPSIGGFQKSVSNTGAETITADVGPISITGEKDIYGNERGASFTAPLTSDTTLEAGKLQAGSTIQYAKATRRDASGKEYNQPTGDLLSELSNSNDSMRDEMSAKGGSSQPIIVNNSSSNSETKVMPIKADPRPSDRGSAFERHVERTSAY